MEIEIMKKILREICNIEGKGNSEIYLELWKLLKPNKISYLLAQLYVGFVYVKRIF